MILQNEILGVYEQVAALTDRMLVLTRTLQWGGLPAMEAQLSDMMTGLKVIESVQTLDAAQSARKCRLLYVINSNQYKISSLIRPQLDGLGAKLKNLESPPRLH
jgi:flagellar protein FliT